MKKIDLGQTATVMANVGVIAGILLLAYELRQNNELMEAEARFNRLSVSTESQTILAENPDLAGFLLRANNNEGLAPEEEARLEAYVRRVFWNMQWTYREAPVPLERWRNLSVEPYRRSFWEANKAEFGQDFVEFMEENVVNER